MRDAAIPARPTVLELVFADMRALARLAVQVFGLAAFLAAVAAVTILAEVVL
jgi:hypothetical protein